MNRYKYFSVTLMMAVFTLLSCTAEHPEDRSCTRAVLEIATPAPGGTRSQGYDSYDRVSDLLLLASDRRNPRSLAMSLYLEGGALDDISFFFPDEAAVYDVFALANTGDVRQLIVGSFEGSGQTLREYMQSLRLPFGDYSAFGVRGVPMSGIVEQCRPGSNVRIRLTRLAAILDVSFDIPSSVSLTVSDFSLMQCSAVCAPFDSGFRCSSPADVVPGCAHSLGSGELQSLSSGKKVRMCLLENSHGCLIPGNVDPHMKVPANTACPELVSYYEFHADVVLGDGTQYKDAIFRFCLGRDTVSDFSVDRNTVYTYNIRMRDSLDGVEWIVEPGEPLYPMPELTGHYSCSFYWDEAALGPVRCCSESLYFDLRSGSRQFSHVPFKFYHYDIYGNEYVFGPYTTMHTYIEDWYEDYGQNGPGSPGTENDRILIYFDSREYLYDYRKMNIVHE